VEKSWVSLQTRLADAAAYLAAGQLTAAYAELESWALVALENIGQPLLTLLTPPGEILQNVADVWDSLVTRGQAVGITRGLLAPPITLSFALANSAETINSAVGRGDLEAALVAAINTPGIAVGAFFNGYRPVLTYDADGNPLTYATEAFQGVFSKSGTIDQIFNIIPKAIQTALKPTVVVPPVVTTPVTTPAITSTSVSTAQTVTLDVPAAVTAKTVDTSTETDTTGSTKSLADSVSIRKALKPAKAAASDEATSDADSDSTPKKKTAGPRHAKKDAASSASDAAPKHAKADSGSDSE
jgi:hypothetical protein